MEIRNNNVEIKASNQLDSWIYKSEKSALYETIFGFAVFLLFGILMYLKSSHDLVWFALGITGLLIYILVYLYGGTIRRGKIINNTVKMLRFNRTSVELITYSFNIFGLKKLSEKQINIERVNLVLKECDYGIIDKNNINGKVISVVNKNHQEYYILTQFFPDLINTYLKC